MQVSAGFGCADRSAYIANRPANVQTNRRSIASPSGCTARCLFHSKEGEIPDEHSKC